MNRKDKLLKALGMGLIIIVLIIARFFTIRFENKGIILYILLFLTQVIYLFDLNAFVYSGICSFCAVAVVVLFGWRTIVLFLPIILFLVLDTFWKQLEKQRKQKSIKSIHLLYSLLFEPLLLLACTVFAMKNRIVSNVALEVINSITNMTICFSVFTMVLIYVFRYRALLSGKEQGKDKNSKIVFQYGFLLVTYIESVVLAFFVQQPSMVRFYLVLLSDLWLGAVLLLYVERRRRVPQTSS